MGGAKAWMMEQEERGYDYVDGNICSDCFIDPTLKKYVSETAHATKCDYCGKSSPDDIAAEFDDVMGVIVQGIAYEWNDPNHEGILYDGAEGGYQAPLTNTYDLIAGHYEITENDKVFDAILESINNDAWVECDFYRGSEDERLMWGWGKFCDEVKYKSRYLFLHKKDSDVDYGEITPADFLYQLAHYKNHYLDIVSLIKEVSPQTDIFRVRIDKQPYQTAGELGAPPQKSALQPNRMSPAGIPMFYGAFDSETSIRETFNPEKHKRGQIISIGTFRPTRIMQFLDLGNLPPIPSVFDPDKRHLIRPLRFFHGFAKDIAEPVTLDGHEHIDYVPTQVVTEFFRHIYKTSEGQRLDGIIYHSSKNEDKPTCVIFCENNQVCKKTEVATEKHMLRLVNVEHRPVA